MTPAIAAGCCAGRGYSIAIRTDLLKVGRGLVLERPAAGDDDLGAVALHVRQFSLPAVVGVQFPSDGLGRRGEPVLSNPVALRPMASSRVQPYSASAPAFQ